MLGCATCRVRTGKHSQVSAFYSTELSDGLPSNTPRPMMYLSQIPTIGSFRIAVCSNPCNVFFFGIPIWMEAWVLNIHPSSPGGRRWVQLSVGVHSTREAVMLKDELESSLPQCYPPPYNLDVPCTYASSMVNGTCTDLNEKLNIKTVCSTQERRRET
jgi:hypothetical protein